MKVRLIILFFVLFLLPATKIIAQNKSDNVCYINNDRIYFQLDRRWSDSEKKEFSSIFSLDSALIAQALNLQPVIIYDSITWEVSRINDNIVELSKSLENIEYTYHENDVILMDDSRFFLPLISPPLFYTPEKYGFNNFSENAAFRYENDTAYFLLPGFQKASYVYLSGTFNNWSTMQLPMQKTNNGWEIRLRLAPGRYLYKYIADGKWISDPNNLQKERDGQSGYNSILYCYNHLFELMGYEKAKKVYLTGSFNHWKKKNIRLSKVDGGWALPIYLEDGTYAYKFIIDKKWITDPGNKNVRADANGNLNSFLGIGDTLMFRLKGFETAQSVILTGSFNGWSHNELKMNKVAGGWELPHVLGPGNYEYKFIVDGRWMPDPANPYTTGSGDYVNSCVTFKPNHTFTLSQFTHAERVIVTGSFNGWQTDNYQMEKTGGVWTYSLFLRPGKYTYKFIVDGFWMIDPANETWEGNSQGTGNSVLWIEP
ncbi:MAG: hypothetical protein HGA37_12600 [Lentimicrobium sp.]|nr:hypothetical protein [Lentimicrobium sp.]